MNNTGATLPAHPDNDWRTAWRWLLYLPGLAAFAVYARTLSRGAFPGESAWLVVQATELAPRLYVDRPLWSLAINGLARLPSHDFVFWFNLFSALCGALAVLLCTWLVARIIHVSIPVYIRRAQPVSIQRAWLTGGLCAGFFLAFATPFWMAATRAHPATLHLAGLLGAATLLWGYTRRPTNRRLWLLAFVYGIGCVEFTTFIVFAPLVGIYLLLFLWLRDLLSVRRILSVIVAGLAGLSLYGLAAWMVMRSDGYGLRDFQGFWHVIWVYWGDQYRFITRGLPQHGWMLTLIVTAIPWLIGILTVRRSLGGDRDTAFRLLYLVLTALTLLVLFNHPITPWRLMGSGRLLVTPYLLSAFLFGILTAGWMLVPLYATINAESGWKRAVQRWGGWIPALAALSLVLWAPFRNLQAADGRPAAVVNRFAEAIVQSAEGFEWLVTDGSLDHHLQIAAHRLDQPLRLLNLTAGNSPVYQRYLAEQFDSLRLRGLLQAGILPFLQEWLTHTPDIEQRVAVLTTPDWFFAAGLTVVPRRLVYHGAPPDNPPDGDALWADHTAFWDRIVPMLEHYRDTLPPVWSRTAEQFLQHSAMVANNLGVLLEDIDRNDLAWQAYHQARRLDDNNISALLNLSLLVQRHEGIPADVTEDIQAGMQRLTETLGERRFHIRMLSRVHGYVRMPQAFADMGWTWALSGNPGMAVSGLQRALALSDNRLPGAQAALASVYLAQEQDIESERVYQAMLEQHPTHPGALIGLARIALLRHQFEQAIDYLDAARAGGGAPDRILFEEAMVALLQGHHDAAREQLEDLVDRYPELTRGWVLLAHIAMQQDDPTRLERIVRQISPAASRDPTVAFALGEIALAGGDRSRARQHFEQSLTLRPANPYILQLLLRFDLQEMRYDLAEQHVSRLLTLDPNHPFGNYVLGVLQVRNGQYSLAEVALRKSVEGARTPYALKDLADVLVQRGHPAEAEPFARDAVTQAPDSHQTWGTLGHVLLRQQRFDDAVEALEHALSLNINNVNASIDLAEAWMHKGEFARARNRLATLDDPASDASVVQRERAASLRRAIQRTAQPL